MSDARPAWFAYSRPHPGKLSARPVHPIGWALLFGLPLPGLLIAAVIAAAFGKVIGALVAIAVALPLSLWLLFRTVIARGVRVS